VQTPPVERGDDYERWDADDDLRIYRVTVSAESLSTEKVDEHMSLPWVSASNLEVPADWLFSLSSGESTWHASESPVSGEARGSELSDSSGAEMSELLFAWEKDSHPPKWPLVLPGSKLPAEDADDGAGWTLDDTEHPLQVVWGWCAFEHDHPDPKAVCTRYLVMRRPDPVPTLPPAD